MDLCKTFRIESAHRLPDRPEGDRDGRIHGHSFRIDIWVTGELDPELGWILDFAMIKKAFLPIHAALDHRYLNEVPGLENPTVDRIAQWIYERMVKAIPQVSSVVVYEMPDSRGSFPVSSANLTDQAHAGTIAALQS